MTRGQMASSTINNSCIVTSFLILVLITELSTTTVGKVTTMHSNIVFPNACFNRCNFQEYCTCRVREDERYLCCKYCRKNCGQNFDGCHDLPNGPPCPKD